MHQITGRAKIAAVIGYPIGHSMSPLLHNYWFEKNRIDGVYVPLSITPENLGIAFKGLRSAGLHGLNVTVPHKISMMEFVNEISEEAREIGAVNTVLFREDQTSIGLNTDGIGFVHNLEDRAPNFVIEGSDIVMLGAGGAARAIAYSLLARDANSITLINRSLARADQLAADLNQSNPGRVRTLRWDKLNATQIKSQLLINTTSLGMHGQPDLKIDLSAMTELKFVYDIVYNPLHTQLLKQALALDLVIIDGLGMLLHQAVPGFEHWGGVTPKVDQELRELVLDQVKG